MTNYPLLALLEARCAFHLTKFHFAKERWEAHKRQGDAEHSRYNTAKDWRGKHLAKHEAAAAKDNEAQMRSAEAGIERERGYIIKWSKIMEPELTEVVRYRTAIAKLRPKQQEWPMGGLVRPGAPYRWQRSDQGQDFEIPLYHSVVAPGNGHCLRYAADRPFPSGFGDPYAICQFHDGPFAVWPAAYLGHANEPIIRPGESFVIGQPLARLNHSLNEGWGWIEFGRWDGGPGPMSEGEKWRHLFKSVWR